MKPHHNSKRTRAFDTHAARRFNVLRSRGSGVWYRYEDEQVPGHVHVQRRAVQTCDGQQAGKRESYLFVRLIYFPFLCTRGCSYTDRHPVQRCTANNILPTCAHYTCRSTDAVQSSSTIGCIACSLWMCGWSQYRRGSPQNDTAWRSL